MEEHLIDSQVNSQLGRKKKAFPDAVCTHQSETQDGGNEQVEELINQSEIVITEEEILNSRESIISVSTQDPVKVGGEERSIPICNTLGVTA